MRGRDYYKSQAKDFLDDMFEVIAETLRSGEDVQIYGFGAFRIQRKKARKYHNVRTREMTEVPEYNTIIFYPSPNLKMAVNEDNENYKKWMNKHTEE